MFAAWTMNCGNAPQVSTKRGAKHVHRRPVPCVAGVPQVVGSVCHGCRQWEVEARQQKGSGTQRRQ